ncbi:ATP-binding protein [Bradyrhizobium sp.]|uniref:sensor histidine kinase n=1 Tax=Bradyrhizobium sp. TaxID=376 RepID=UPI0026096577|nr:ATP-binding protein [Bradyrhizobium sp.]
MARLCAIALVLELALAPIPSLGATGESLLRLDHAEFVLSDSSEAPSDSLAWQPQGLPDDWVASRPDVWGYGWYRLRFVLPGEPHELYAVHLPVLKGVAALYVNGGYIGQTETFGRGDSTDRPSLETPLLVPERGLFAHVPRLFAIRPELLHTGVNTAYVRLQVRRGASGVLSRVTIGPEPLVRSEYDRTVFVSLSGPGMISIFSAGFGAFILLLWLRRRHESMYGYFGLTALAFALFVAGRFVITEPPIPFPYWGILVWVGLEGYIVFLCLFALRYAGWRWPRLERWLWAYLAVSPFIDYASFVGIGGWIPQHWWLMTFVLTLVYVGVFWATAWRRKTLETLGLAVAGSVKLIISANERLLPHPIDLPRYQPFAYVPMFMMIGWILIDRFVKSLNESEKLNAELEHRVAQKHAELEQSYRHMQQMERQQAIVEERRRIMRDMHDGIGAQLISALSLVEHGESSATEIAAALRECLDDLRLTIDSLEPTENDLLPVMGNLRYRLDGRLRKQGIDLDWQVREVPGLFCLTPQNVLHILRILQEAFTNIVKHAHASSIHVETGLDAAGEHVYIQVRDNGTGFCGEHAGRGIASMRHRAKIIGGRLEIKPSAAGTTLNLLLPVS